MKNINFIETLVEQQQTSQEHNDDSLRYDGGGFKKPSPRKIRFPLTKIALVLNLIAALFFFFGDSDVLSFDSIKKYVEPEERWQVKRQRKIEEQERDRQEQKRQEHPRPGFQPALLPPPRELTEREIFRIQYRRAKEQQKELEKRINNCASRFNTSYVLPLECKQWHGSKEKKIHCVNDKIRARRAFFQANCPELIGSHRR